MADASVGGKTGFDHPAGKNLVGAIHQPRAVVADLAHLQTLSLRELRAGFAEIVKVALIGDPDLFALLESKAAAFAAGGVVSPGLASVLRAAVAIKARIVRDDEHELGQRALLNLGHTVGHALEAHGGYRKYLHGEAVAMGLCVEVDLAVKRGLTPPDVAARTRALLRSLGLPTDVAGDEWRGAKRFVRSDKKRREGRLHLPFVQALGKAEVRDTPPDFFET
jgi:3-dehydroquinate synthetase